MTVTALALALLAATAPAPPPYAGAYQPVGVDEIGAWAEADEDERQLALSPLLIRNAALDAYGSTGRKLLQIVAMLGPGIPLSAGEHAGYAGLVDLRTGDLLWLNADRAMGGDLRTPEGAATRVRQLLANFPGSTPAPR